MIRLGKDIKKLEAERQEIQAELYQTAGTMSLQRLERLTRRLHIIITKIKLLHV